MKLTKLEHYLLSSLCDDLEPLHILYADLKKELPDTDRSSFIGALAKLASLGLLKAYFYDYSSGAYEPRGEITQDVLRMHWRGPTEESLSEYPARSLGGELFFEITEKGRREEARKIYAPYYAEGQVKAS